MKSNNLVSIVIPVYNVEPWLNKCIDSILNQTYKNIEIILINDGSTDRSGDICDQYRYLHNRISVIHNKNSGVAHSRNLGIKKSKGKYIMFLDSDDYISDNKILDKFINILEKEKSDFIYTSYCRFNDGNYNQITEILPINVSNTELKNKSGIEILSLLIERKSYHHAPYLKICRREFLINNNIYFKDGVYHEDVDWTAKLFINTHKISICYESYYMRRMRESSIITTTDENIIAKKICDRLEIAYELSLIFKKIDNNDCLSLILEDIADMY